MHLEGGLPHHSSKNLDQPAADLVSLQSPACLKPRGLEEGKTPPDQTPPRVEASLGSDTLALIGFSWSHSPSFITSTLLYHSIASSALCLCCPGLNLGQQSSWHTSIPPLSLPTPKKQVFHKTAPRPEEAHAIITSRRGSSSHPI